MPGASTSRHYAIFLTSDIISVTLTNPTAGGTITDASPTWTWTFAPGTQSTYRVRVWEEAAMTTLVYDSGVTSSPNMNHTIPAGSLLTGQTYYTRVDITTTAGDAGQSAVTEFDTLFGPDNDITGVTIQLVGDQCDVDSRVLPHVVVRWDAAVPAGAETFTQYDVRRRLAGETSYTRIAVVTDQATTIYRDYAAMPGVQYEYSIIWEGDDGGVSLISSDQDPPALAMLRFDWLFVHAETDPTTFVRYDSFRAALSIEQDVAFRRTWGRQAPVAQIGEAQSLRVVVPGRPDLLSDPRKWGAITGLVSSQRTGSTTLVARFGRQRRGIFCQAVSVGRQENQKDFAPSITLVEVAFDESV